MSRSIRNLRRDRPSHDRSAQLVRRQARAVAIAPTAPIVSGRTLDFLSLTVCSCALTLLCHSAANPPQASATANNTPLQTRPAPGSRAALHPYTVPSSRPTLKAKGKSSR